jgi:hypothetical protein
VNSKIEVRAPRPGEIELIASRAAEPWVREAATDGRIAKLIERPLTYVGLYKGELIVAGGYMDFGHRAAVGWSTFAQPPRGALRPLVRLVVAHMLASPFDWIEAHCIEDFQPAIRWVRAIGFEPLTGHVLEINGRVFNRYVWRR